MEPNQVELQQFDLPLEVFENQPAAKLATNPNILIMEDFRAENGIEVLVRGNKYHFKGMPTPQVVDAIAATKRIFVKGIKVFRGVGIPYLWFFRGRIIEAFTDYTERVLCAYYLKPKYYCKTAREVYRIGMKFAGQKVAYQRLVKWIVMVLEYDDAYRYRFQDAWGEAKSIEGGLRIFLARTGQGDKDDKWTQIGRLFWMLKLFMRTLIREIDQEMDWNEVVMDIPDLYHALPKENYNCKGLSMDARLKLRETL